MSDEDDIRDAMLFRFWCRAASDFPSETARKIMFATTPDDYRAALRELALARGVNLP